MPEEQRVTEALERAFEERLLPRSGCVLVAVSGGQDSVALLHAMIATAPSRLRIHVGHVDHGIRPSSSADAEHVRRLAQQFNVPITVERFDVPSLAEETGANLEAAARSVRYRLLADMAARLGAPGVITAHTADDRVETMILHLLRGAGLEGLVGLTERQILPAWTMMQPTDDQPAAPGDLCVMRPLLSIWRRETAQYCEGHGLDWLSDASNEDPSFTRNRIRHGLIPLLETYNPAVREGLLRLGTLAADDVALIRRTVDRAWRRNVRAEDGMVRLNRSALIRLPASVSGRLLRRAAERAGSGTQLSFAQVDRCLRLAERGGSAVELPGRMVCRASDGEIVITRRPSASKRPSQATGES